jgi:hypothetical protein
MTSPESDPTSERRTFLRMATATGGPAPEAAVGIGHLAGFTAP